MKKKIDVTCIMSSFVCLVPMILAIVLYSDLPEQMPIHWNATGAADHYVSKNMVIFGMPLLMLVMNVIVHLTINYSQKNITKAEQVLKKWLIPVLSLIIIPICLFISK
ncbi:DUF1648 domain-containing protein [Bacillus sp. C1]